MRGQSARRMYSPVSVEAVRHPLAGAHIGGIAVRMPLEALAGL